MRFDCNVELFVRTAPTVTSEELGLRRDAIARRRRPRLGSANWSVASTS